MKHVHIAGMARICSTANVPLTSSRLWHVLSGYSLYGSPAACSLVTSARAFLQPLQTAWAGLPTVRRRCGCAQSESKQQSADDDSPHESRLRPTGPKGGLGHVGARTSHSYRRVLGDPSVAGPDLEFEARRRQCPGSCCEDIECKASASSGDAPQADSPLRQLPSLNPTLEPANAWRIRASLPNAPMSAQRLMPFVRLIRMQQRIVTERSSLGTQAAWGES